MSGLKIRGAARIQNLLQEHRETALLARQLTGVAIDPDLDIGAGDLERRRVSQQDIASVCNELGLGRMTTARLSRTIL